MLSLIKVPIKQEMVNIGNDLQINTISTSKKSITTHPPLLMVHGFGAAIGFWCKNIDALSEHYTVYAIDLLGFGRSSRPVFKGKTPDDAELWWVNSIEEWRKKMNIDQFYILGHSLGGYIVARYALRYPERVIHLILADPVGVPRKPKEWKVDWRWKLLSEIVWKMPLLGVVRALGPWGPNIIHTARVDLTERFPFTDNTVTNYIYHLAAQPPSGETAFAKLFGPGAWAHQPLCELLPNLKLSQFTMLYGNQSWMDPTPAKKLRDDLQHTHLIHIHTIFDAGHHIYTDNAEEFNSLVIKCKNKVKEFIKKSELPA